MCLTLFLFLVMLGRHLFGQSPFPSRVEFPMLLLTLTTDVSVIVLLITLIRAAHNAG